MTSREIPPTQRLAAVVGVAVIAMSFALAVFISAIGRDLGPPEVVPRGLALGALYATAGLIAVLGARRNHPALVTAAGILCLAGSVLSIATVIFLLPAILLVILGLGSSGRSGRRSGDRRIVSAAVGAIVVVLVVAAAVALLGLSETRCWVATGTAAEPVYEILAPGEPLGTVGGPDGSFASGCDGGALTLRGVAAEFILLGSAIWLASGRPRPRRWWVPEPPLPPA